MNSQRWEFCLAIRVGYAQSTNLLDWTAFRTNQVLRAEVEVFNGSAFFPHRFYRARLVP